ncbi:helix-turn-helix transcriptional regulator [uncultured Mitsuokella sp.]|uniref:helix-turn-helix transcriptional regulator n=1 Tax=uncultured Mitsuokella sp. TaxID=453120 RepID=UPI00259632D4|nr:helix-turn-helix transcriptional regulator [uncultured Mitsuokella sp.]
MQALKRLRLKRGLTQAELADILHVNRTTVTLWEKGINNPRTAMLMKLAKALHCKVDDLFRLETTKRRTRT